MFEIGCDLFQQSGHGNSYKPMDSWWLIDADDIMYRIEDPSMEKLQIELSTSLMKKWLNEVELLFYVLCTVQHFGALITLQWMLHLHFLFEFRHKDTRFIVPGLKWLQSY